MPATRQQSIRVVPGTATALALGLPGRTPATQPLLGTHVLSDYVAQETDAALAVGAVRSIGTGLSAESDSGIQLVPTKLLIAALSTESGSALAPPVGFHQLPMGLATETDVALARSAKKLAPIGLAASSNTAVARAVKKVLPARIATETDVALARGWFSRRASETDAALSAAIIKRTAVGRSNEADSELSVAVRKRIAAGLATETDAALARTAHKLVTLGMATETEVAIELHRVLRIGMATESNAVRSLFNYEPVLPMRVWHSACGIMTVGDRPR